VTAARGTTAAIVVVLAFGALIAWVSRTRNAPPVATNARTPEPPAAPPRNEFERELARLPEPSAAAAFEFEGEISLVGGSFRLAVTPCEHDARAAWHVVQEESRPASLAYRSAQAEHTEMWLSRDLRVLGDARTIVSNGVVHTTPIDAASTRTIPLAAALLYFRACPAEVTALPDPVERPVVSQVEPDGGLFCSAFTSDCDQVFITLQGPRRTPVKVERCLGWHNMGTIAARVAPK